MPHDGVMTDPVPTGKPNARMRQTVGDMVRSMAVVLAVVAVLMLISWRPEPDPVRVVDPVPITNLAVSRAEFPILIPAIDDLRPTSARWEPTIASGDVPVWHIGYVTPEEQYLQLTQSTVSDPNYLEEQTLTGAMTEILEIEGAQWQLYVSKDESALVNMDNGVTTIVRGTGAKEDLIRAVESLQPASATASE